MVRTTGDETNEVGSRSDNSEGPTQPEIDADPGEGSLPIQDDGIDNNRDNPDVVPNSTDGAGPSSRQARAGWYAVSALLVAVVVSSLLAFAFSDSGRVRLEPGPTYPISYNGQTPSGTMSAGIWSMTTISVTRLTWAESTFYELLGDPDLLTTLPSVGTGASTEMLAAKQTAALVAENILGGGSTDQHIVVIEVIEGSPAATIGLRAGDRLVRIDGVETDDFDSVGRLLSDGADELVYQRRDEMLVASLSGLIGENGKLGVRLVGLARTTLIDADEIDTEDVGGSSGGLIFTLSLLDVFTDGDLTGGMRIAGTGTIRSDGAVGSILGAAYKLRAAEQDHDVFFVPRRNFDELPPDSGIEVVPVDDIGDALAWLCANGGSSPICDRLG
jgi:PDZ domain-containing secreted protein